MALNLLRMAHIILEGFQIRNGNQDSRVGPESQENWDPRWEEVSLINISCSKMEDTVLFFWLHCRVFRRGSYTGVYVHKYDFSNLLGKN